MRDLAGFRDAVEQYCKRVGRTQKDLAAALYLTEGDLNKRLHDYSHQPSRRTWRLKPEHTLKIVEALARWGAITARKQAFALFTLIDFPTLAEEIDWQTTPWSKLHADASQTEHPPLSLLIRLRPFQARDLPKDYVPRPILLKELKRLLLTQEDQQLAAITTALRGSGGFGKTTLASAICHDPEIQKAFPDGILWVELGEKQPRPIDVLNELLSVLDPSRGKAPDLKEARKHWQNVLKERSCLLVIDDIWQTEVMEELLKGGPHCARLITTRNDQLLPETAKRVWVDAMEPAEAMALLCEGVIDEWQYTLDPSVLEQVVVQQLGCWPLLVSLARGILKNQVRRLGKAPKRALALLKHAYEERGMATFHLGDRDERQRNVDACVEVNLRQLEQWVPQRYRIRQRYQELAVFPEDTDIPLATLQTYWQGTGDLQDWETEELCLHMSDLSLVLPWDSEHRMFRLHDVMRRYLIQHVGEQLPALHSRLLGAFQQAHSLIRWANLPRSEEYLWQHLVFHLCQADCSEALQATLTDLGYLTRKGLYMGVSALETDFVLASTWPSAHLPFPPVTGLSRTIMRISHLLRQAQTEAEMGSVLLNHIDKKLATAAQRDMLERELPRPFLVTWNPLPNRVSSTLRRTLAGHTNTVNGCAVSGDGRVIVSACWDGTLKVWDGTTGAALHTIKGHPHWVRGCAVSPDGDFIVSASGDETLKVWDGTTGTLRFTLSGHTNTVNGCAVSGDGRVIVSACWDGTLKVWDASTGAERFTLSGHMSYVHGCAVSADGRVIVSASDDKTLKVWDGTTGTLRRTLAGHTGPVRACALSPDGEWVVSASDDETLKVWNANSGAELHTLRGHTAMVYGCAVSGDGHMIVSASVDCTLKTWDRTTGAALRTLRGHTLAVLGCAVSADGRVIVSASDDKTLKVWDVAPGTELRTLRSYADAYLCAVSADGRVIVSVSDDLRLKVRDIASGTKLCTLRGHIDTVNGCAISADGHVIVSASSDKTLKVWDGTTGAVLRTLRGHTREIYGCVVSADGRMIVSACWDCTLKVWDGPTGTLRFTLSGHRGYVNGCAMSADGRVIISASDDETLKVWDANSGAELHTLRGHTNKVRACAVSGDGRMIVSACWDGTLKVWDGITGAELRTLFGHIRGVNGCAVSPNGRWIVSASADCTLKVWNAVSGLCLLTFPVDGTLFCCAFLSDGERFVACGDGGAYFLRLVV